MTAKEIYCGFGLSLGADPEIFVGRQLRNRFAPVESRVVVPVDGIIVENPNHYNQGVVRDGVQAELHVGGAGYSCRQAIANSISRHIGDLANAVEAYNKGKRAKLSISFQPLVTLTARDRSKMDAESLELNCRESLNAYGRTHIQRDGKTYPYRSGSGHLHLGTTLFRQVDINLAVKILDVLIGVVCVLIARNPGEAIRRETYGRAGEYRLPQHGLEYRVPSNFWLANYKLSSLITGQVKLAHRVVSTLLKNSGDRWAAETVQNGVEKAGGWEVVEKAINTNDRDLALRIYTEAIRPLAQMTASYQGIAAGRVDAFEYFVETVNEGGLQRWFGPQDDQTVLSHWHPYFNRDIGWERFCTEIVEPSRKASKFTGIVLSAPQAKVETTPVATVAKRRRSRAEAVLQIAA